MTSYAKLKPGELTFPRLLVFFLSFSLILIYSLSPSVYVADSGLFAAASYFLGTAHPPAYPLFILIGKLLTFIPFGNIGLKVNLMSAVFGALTILVSYNASLYLTKNHIISMLAPLTILTSPNFILESSKAEVYTLNTFLIMLIFYFCLRALKEDTFFKNILISSFFLGLGMTNHHTIGFMLFPIIYVLVMRRKELPFGTVVSSILLFIAGFSVYLFLYLRSIANTFISYSKVYSLVDFFSIFFRLGYSMNTVSTLEGVYGQGVSWFYSIKNIGLIMSNQMHPLIWFFVLLGIVGIFKDRKNFAYVSVSILIWIVLAEITIREKEPTHKTLSVVSPYFLQLIPILGVISAAGLLKCYEMIKTRSSLISRTIVTGLIGFQMVYVPVAVQQSSLSDYFIAYNWIKDLSKVLKLKSFYLGFGDNPGFLSFYGFGVERLRDDVLVMDAASGDNNLRLTLSPRKKFSVWYPEFYETQGTSVKYFYPFAGQGRVFSSMIGSIPKGISKKFDVKWYVLGSILLLKDNHFPFKERFKEDFQKIDYLPVAIGEDKDFMTLELIRKYAYTIWEYANFLADENSKDTDFYYRLSFFISTRGWQFEVIKDYIKFLSEKRGIESAKKIVSELKNIAPDSEKTKKEVENIEKWFKIQNDIDKNDSLKK